MKDLINRLLQKKYFVSVFSLLFAALFTIAITAAFSSCNFLMDEDDTVIADNVFVFNPENAEEEIVACDENSMTIKTIYGVTEGSILSSGANSKTPHGALRKVESIEKVDEGYKVNTQQAALTEAIKHCDLHYTAVINQDGSYSIVNKDPDKSSSVIADVFIQKAYADEVSIGKEFGIDNVLFEGKFGYAINFDCYIDFGYIYFKVTGEVYATADLKDFSKLDTGDIDLPTPDIPDIEFMAGPVPVVITNSLDLVAHGTAQIYSLKLKAGVGIHKICGFEYCTDYGVRPICEDKSYGPYMSYAAQKDNFRGLLSASLTATYTAKLYGLAGFDLSVAAVDDFNFHLKKLASYENANGCIHVPGLDWDLKGELHNKVYIPISGHFVLGGTIDIFGLKFPAPSLEQELFNTNDAITLMDDNWVFGDLENDPDFNADNQIALVLDISGSMSGKPLEQLKSACVTFVNNMAITSRILISIIGFESNAEVLIEDSRDVATLLATINSLKDKGSTNIEDGLLKAENILMKNQSTKKSIVLMSDGEPNCGKTGSSLTSYADSLKNKGITIYTVGFFHSVSGSKSTSQKLMEDLASPGFHYEADSPASLQEFFDQIASQIQGVTYYYVEIKCPVDVTVSYNGETLSSVGASSSMRRSFGSLNFEDQANSSDKAKILRLKQGPSYDIRINGTGTGNMNYSISYVNESGKYDDTRYFDNIPVNNSTKIDTKAKLTDVNEMTVDANGDGLNVTKYRAASNQHAVQYTDNVVDNHEDQLYEEEEMGFFEWLFKTINRFFSDLLSWIWFMIPIK